MKFGSLEDFALAVVASFSQGKAQVIHLCCFREKHKKSGEHYHIAVKLD